MTTSTVYSAMIATVCTDTRGHGVFDPDIHSATTVGAETTASMLAFIRPRPEELTWQAIPWQTTIPEAIRTGERLHKPVLLWTMNGNPLSLT